MAGYIGPDSELQPDAVTIRSFITWWFERCDRGVIEIGWLDNQGRGLIHFSQHDKSQIDELVAIAVQSNLVPGQSCYIRASTVARWPDGQPGRTKDTDFIQAPGIWNDIDTPAQLAQAMAVESMVRPTASVETGTEPNKRYQNWFKTSQPFVNGDMVRSLNRRIQMLYGGDPAVINPSRLMRLPGTIAWPTKAGRTVPELTRFILPAPSDPRPAAYSLSMLEAQLPKEAVVDSHAAGAASYVSAGASTQPVPGMRATLDTTSELMRLIKSGSNWHNNMIRLVAHWVGRGWSTQEILTAAEAFTLPGYTVDATLREVTAAINGARTKWGVADRDTLISTTLENQFPSEVIDPWDTLVAPPFPIDALPGILRAYTESRARVVGADPCAIAWSALSACSAAINGSTRVRMKLLDRWSEPPAMWVALLGRPSTKKTPIISDAWRPLTELQNVALRAYRDQMAYWKALPKDTRAVTPEPPKPRRLVAQDATIESLQSILSEQERGIGVLRDELSGFIGGMERYASKGGNGAERGFWLETYNGGGKTVDRIVRGSTYIDNLLATICGGIQPDRLESFSDITDDGLWQRFIPIIVTDGEFGVDQASDREVDDYTMRLQDIVDRPVAKSVVFSNTGYEICRQVERELFDLQKKEPVSVLFAGYIGKLIGVFGRLSMALLYMETSGFEYIISETIALQARRLIFESILPNAARVYMRMDGYGPKGDGLEAAAGYILSKNLDRFVISDLTSNIRQFKKLPTNDILRMLSPLINGGWILPESELPNNRSWIVNPVVHVKFLDRKNKEIVRRKSMQELIQR